jgi:hypothetical protein
MALAVTEVSYVLVTPNMVLDDGRTPVIAAPWVDVENIRLRPESPQFIEPRYRSSTRHMIIESKTIPRVHVYAFEDGLAMAQHIVSAWRCAWERQCLGLPTAVQVVLPSATDYEGRKSQDVIDSDDEDDEDGSVVSDAMMDPVGDDLRAADAALERFDKNMRAESSALERASMLKSLAAAVTHDRRLKVLLLSRRAVPSLLGEFSSQIRALRSYLPPPLPHSEVARREALERHELRRQRNWERAFKMEASLQTISATLFASECIPPKDRAGVLRFENASVSMEDAIHALMEDPSPLYWVPGVLEAYHLALLEFADRADRTGTGEVLFAPVVPGDPRYYHSFQVNLTGKSFRSTAERALGVDSAQSDQLTDLHALASLLRISFAEAEQAHRAAMAAAHGHMAALPSGPRFFEEEVSGEVVAVLPSLQRDNDTFSQLSRASPAIATRADERLAHQHAVLATPYGTYVVGTLPEDERVWDDAERGGEHVKSAPYFPFRLGYPAPPPGASLQAPGSPIRASDSVASGLRLQRTAKVVLSSVSSDASGFHAIHFGPLNQTAEDATPVDTKKHVSAFERLEKVNAASGMLDDVQTLLDRTVPTHAELSAMARHSGTGKISSSRGLASLRDLASSARSDTGRSRLTQYQQACLDEVMQQVTQLDREAPSALVKEDIRAQGAEAVRQALTRGLIRNPHQYVRDIQAAHASLMSQNLSRERVVPSATISFAGNALPSPAELASAPSLLSRDFAHLQSVDRVDIVERFRERLATGKTPYPADPSKFYGYGQAADVAETLASTGGKTSQREFFGGTPVESVGSPSFASIAPAHAAAKSLLRRAKSGIVAFSADERTLRRVHYRHVGEVREQALQEERRSAASAATRVKHAVQTVGFLQALVGKKKLNKAVGPTQEESMEALLRGLTDFDRVRRRPGMVIRLVEARAEARFRALMDLRSDEVAHAKRRVQEEQQKQEEAPPSPSSSLGSAETRESSQEEQLSRERRMVELMYESRDSGVFGVGQPSPLKADERSAARRRKFRMGASALAMFTSVVRSQREREAQASGIVDATTRARAMQAAKEAEASDKLLAALKTEKRLAEIERQNRSKPIGLLPPEASGADVLPRWGNSINAPRRVTVNDGVSQLLSQGLSAPSVDREYFAKAKAASQLIREEEEPVEAGVGNDDSWRVFDTIEQSLRDGPSRKSGRSSAVSAGSLRSGPGEEAVTSPGSLLSQSLGVEEDSEAKAAEDDHSLHRTVTFASVTPPPSRGRHWHGASPRLVLSEPGKHSQALTASPMRSRSVARSDDQRKDSLRYGMRSASSRARAVVGVADDLMSSIRRVRDPQGRSRVIGVLSLPVTALEEKAAHQAEVEAETMLLRQVADALEVFSDGGSSAGSEYRRKRSPSERGALGSPKASPMRSPSFHGPASSPKASPMPSPPGRTGSFMQQPAKRVHYSGAMALESTESHESEEAVPPLWQQGHTPREDKESSRRLTWSMVARIRSLQIEVMLRLYDSVELLIDEKAISPSNRLTLVVADSKDLVVRPFALHLLSRAVGLTSRIGLFLEVSIGRSEALSSLVTSTCRVCSRRSKRPTRPSGRRSRTPQSRACCG